MAKPTIRKVCPPASELSEIKINIPCPEEGCGGLFFNSAMLDMHLLKHHKKLNSCPSKREDVSVQYHCPVDSCPYHMGSERFFKCMKYLKQHFLKAHAEKKFCCEKCGKGFPTEAARKYHLPTCGVAFVCSCKKTYGSYGALVTHAKRTFHTFDKKFRLYGRSSANNMVEAERLMKSQDIKFAPATVAVSIQLLAAVALNELSHPAAKASQNKEVQTEPSYVEGKRARRSPQKAGERAAKRRTSAQTQTGSVSRHKQPKISAQTQTSGDCILKKAMQAADIPVAHGGPGPGTKQPAQARRRRKSMETQTSGRLDKTSKDKHLMSTSGGSFDMSLSELFSTERNTSSTQTIPGPAAFQTDTLSSLTQTDMNEPSLCEPASLLAMDSYAKPLGSLNSFFDDSLEGVPKLESCFQAEDASLMGDEPGYSEQQIESILTRNQEVMLGGTGSCSTETQTEVDLGEGCSPHDDLPFTLCLNNETQTTEDFSCFDDLLYSNMCTQTCDDAMFLDFDFNSIETQTVGSVYREDLTFASAETQTPFSDASLVAHDSPASWLSEMSNMETQTDVDSLIAELSKNDTNHKLL
ncbi:uncharacterized protein LOC134537725 [Bacillus rossius redtenbacheri]|uniref:uncharacterized protein LOC134537725 n=1 Tax=Bacillus rossius redtenbacheri TaxID=93214 RepID=UPI002FDEC3AD